MLPFAGAADNVDGAAKQLEDGIGGAAKQAQGGIQDVSRRLQSAVEDPFTAIEDLSQQARHCGVCFINQVQYVY